MKLINLHTADYGEHLLSGDQIILSNNFDRRVNIGHSPCRNISVLSENGSVTC